MMFLRVKFSIELVDHVVKPVSPSVALVHLLVFICHTTATRTAVSVKLLAGYCQTRTAQARSMHSSSPAQLTLHARAHARTHTHPHTLTHTSPHLAESVLYFVLEVINLHVTVHILGHFFFEDRLSVMHIMAKGCNRSPDQQHQCANRGSVRVEQIRNEMHANIARVRTMILSKSSLDAFFGFFGAVVPCPV